MIFSYYHETALEQWISDKYRSNQILTPEDLDIERIAGLFGIDLEYDNCKSFSDNEEKVIILDKREAILKTRVIFFHELCHVLRHVGDQRKMPGLFKEAQESEAENFVLYAAMPFYIISKLIIPDQQNEAIQFLALIFKVPLKVAKQRLEQIQRRELQGVLISTKQKDLFRLTPQEAYVDPIETNVYAYYDPTGDFESPSQLIVNVNQQTLLTQEELIFSTDGPFERVEESQLQAFVDCKPVKFNDLDYTRDGKISLRLSHLASRYYNSAFKFLIQMRDIEEVMKFHGVYV